MTLLQIAIAGAACILSIGIVVALGAMCLGHRT